MLESLLTFDNMFVMLVVANIIVVFVFALREIRLEELFTSGDGSGNISHTKFWANIAYLVSTVAFIRLNFIESFQNNLAEIWLIFLLAIAGNSSASKWLSLKYKQQNNSHSIKEHDE